MVELLRSFSFDRNQSDLSACYMNNDIFKRGIRISIPFFIKIKRHFPYCKFIFVKFEFQIPTPRQKSCKT